MNRSWIDQIKQSKEHFTNYWGARSSKQKGLIIGTFLFLIVALSTTIFFASRPNYIPLYEGQLSTREVGDIKAELDKQGFTEYQLSESGTMILVPQKEAPKLLVSLASAGYPKSNEINYDVFSENLTFGATDRQYDILEREAMQNKLADVLKYVDGIKNAEVILTLPEDSVFIREDQQENSTASVMVEVEPGAKLTSAQIQALYTLVSRGVPKLPMDNITIMNQYSETLALDTSEQDEQSLDKYDKQRKIQKDVEQDIQRGLQSLLGTILGTNKVYVHTFVKMNFDKVKTEENLVKPTNENNEGIPISSERNSVSQTGGSKGNGGVVGTGETDVPGYVAEENGSGSDSTYEELQEKVNYEVNRINNQITKSPYVIDDITINVGVESNASEPNKLPQDTLDNIRNVVSNTVRTALGHPELTDEEVEQRITIFPHKFEESKAAKAEDALIWPYIAGGVAAAVLLGGGIVLMLMRRRKKAAEADNPFDDIPLQKQPQSPEELEYFAQQEMGVESQLKKLLEQRPEDFSKMLRTWLNEEEA
ncbi:flagellar M-ring protein FliF [Bacillus sp. DNRA2]|uniref:flagellar basal-body MS-ring/collar protein FliF n=1 Tax=Bacillus sp. DNRA2 TaxID=2723053 RepID=UPI00145D4EE6|nr:flagellar basal-body MS-ring/collar protein FliF [Bacillus sp. DNRA2]NMD69092.1 flagellar M-ring protein FliF [Bacillus sp. DNRA2]